MRLRLPPEPHGVFIKPLYHTGSLSCIEAALAGRGLRAALYRLLRAARVLADSIPPQDFALSASDAGVALPAGDAWFVAHKRRSRTARAFCRLKVRCAARQALAPLSWRTGMRNHNGVSPLTTQWKMRLHRHATTIRHGVSAWRFAGGHGDKLCRWLAGDYGVRGKSIVIAAEEHTSPAKAENIVWRIRSLGESPCRHTGMPAEEKRTAKNHCLHRQCRRLRYLPRCYRTCLPISQAHCPMQVLAMVRACSAACHLNKQQRLMAPVRGVPRCS